MPATQELIIFNILSSSESFDEIESSTTRRVEGLLKRQFDAALLFKGASFDLLKPFLVYDWEPRRTPLSNPRFEIGRIIQPTGIQTGRIYVHAATVKKIHWTAYAAHLRVVALEFLRVVARKYSLKLDEIDAAIAKCPKPPGPSPFYEGKPRLGRMPKDPHAPTVDVELVIPLKSRTFTASRQELAWLQPLDLALYERLPRDGVGELATCESGRGSSEISMLGKRSASIMASVKATLKEMNLCLPRGSHFLVHKIDSDAPAKKIPLPPQLLGDPQLWVAANAGDLKTKGKKKSRKTPRS